MANKLHAQLRRMLRVPVLLEREDRQHQIDITLNLLRPAGVPCPQLRRNVVDDFDPTSLHLRGKPKIESRKVHEHHGIRPASLRSPDKFPEEAAELAVVLQHFHEADHRVLR